MDDVFDDRQQDPDPTDDKCPEDRRDNAMIQNPSRPGTQHDQERNAQQLGVVAELRLGRIHNTNPCG